jgi:peptidyl-prolyl cis-trans isomerase D
MFNLFRSRQKAVRYMLVGILSVVGLSMVVYLIPGFGGPTAPRGLDEQVLAEVGGNKITAQYAIATFQQVTARQNIPPGMLEYYLPQFIDQMVQDRAVVYEFERMGITASDDEVYTLMTQEFPQFFQNGQLTNKDQFQGWLAQQGLTLEDAIENVREAIILQKAEVVVIASTVVTPKELDDAVGQRFDKAKIKYVAFPGAKFHDQVKVTPEEIKAFFATRRGDYPIPEKRSFVVLVIDQDKVEQSINVTDAQLHAAYSSNLDNFRTPERVHVRHILLDTRGKSDAEKKQLLAKAQDLLKQLNSGADFAQLAQKNSDDTSNAPKGGDLGWKGRGELVPEFEKAAFALQPKQISGIVTTEFGYHIIQGLERESARVKPFDEVKAKLADELKKQGVSEKIQSIGDQMQAALNKSPGSAVAIAAQFGATPVTVTDAEQGAAIPTVGISPEIDNALAGLKKNEVSPVLVLPANRLAVVELTGRTPARAAELNEVESKVRDALIDQRADGFALDKAKEAASRMRAGEDMAKVAKSMKLEVTESTEFTHADAVEGVGSAVQIPDAFTKPIGSIVGPINELGRGTAGVPPNLVYQVVDQVHVEPAKLMSERASTLEQLKKAKALRERSLFEDSVFARLVSEKKVVENKDAIKRLVTSLRGR